MKERNPKLAFLGLIEDFLGWETPALTRRDFQWPQLAGKADAIIGMRRSGKTSIMYQLITDLLDMGIERSRILYINFEDDRLPKDLEASDLSLLLELFYEHHPQSREQQSWFFFDEIQVVSDWERFIRRVLDTENAQIVISGSSSKLLAQEIATSMRGRSLASEVFPFSFQEALRHSGIEVTDQNHFPKALRSHMAAHFNTYLQTGGFAEVQALSEEMRTRVLRDYVDVVLLRDLIERHDISNVSTLRALVRHVIRNPSGELSVHRLYNDFRSRGLKLGKNLLYDYLAQLEEAYLAFSVFCDSDSERKQQTRPRKLYLVDHGLAALSGLPMDKSVGSRLENFVYIELRRRGYTIHYALTDTGYEVDFVARKDNEALRLIQVCAGLDSEQTSTRELRALDEAMASYKVPHSSLITLGESKQLTLENGNVDVTPAWKWALALDA